jgi:DNA-binding beta-propeller fold protein YncE
MIRARPRLAIAAVVAVCTAAPAYALYGSPAKSVSARAAGSAPPAVLTRGSSATRHYEYVFPDGAMFVYDIDHGHRLVEQRSLPGVRAIRGVAVSPVTHMLFIAYGGNGGSNGNGALLKYDLVADRMVWDRAYPTGVDSLAVGRDGRTIYLPDGSGSGDGRWNVIDAGSGRIVGQINGGAGAHNTVVGLSGARVYLGGENFPYLELASTATNRVVGRVGPLVAGVRPFTINGRETVAYTTATGFLGFQVSSITTGRVLYTVRLPSRFRWNPATFAGSAPSHGVSLSPDERQVWVIDAPNSYVHVFEVSGVPTRPPRRIADIKLLTRLTGNESPCVYACGRESWLQHSRSGCLVYVGDSGDVYSTVTFRRVAFLPALRNTRKFLEVDWSRGKPVATTSRHGLGYVTGRDRPPPPKC